MKLYELIEARHDIEELFANEEISFEDYQENLEMVQELIKEKAQNIIAVEKNINADIAALKAEEERLSKKRKVLENKLASFKKFIIKGMADLGVEKIVTTLGNVSIRKSQAVSITDERKVPEMFIKTETKETIMKLELLKFLKTGEKVPGAELQENYSLNIK